MKRSIILFLSLFFVASTGYAQVEEPTKKAKKEGEGRVNEKVDEGIQKGFDKVEDGIGGLFGKKKKKKGDESTVDRNVSESTGKEDRPEMLDDKSTSGHLNWAKYDFVPGDKILFEDDLFYEENGEFPSRWDLSRGVVEVAELDGQNVIMFRGGSPTIIPYLEDPSSDYLPDVFTIEFDVYPGGKSGWMNLYLYDAKNQSKPSGIQNSMDIHYNKMDIYGSASNYPDKNIQRNRWIHIAVAYTKGKFKAYMDDTRLINIPRLDVNPTGISLHCYHASDENPIYVKNIRIAEGGVKYYDRIMQDGKIVTNGIRFDIGMATIKPESMGIINEIYDLLNEHSELNFSVEGHTDSDGDFNYNQVLSENRANAVKDKLIKMGIDKGRLTAAGHGEKMPIDTNNTPEGKANNRRVEFVKM